MGLTAISTSSLCLVSFAGSAFDHSAGLGVASTGRPS